MIYKITGPTGLGYVGMTCTSLRQRWSGQVSSAKGPDGKYAGEGRLYRAIREHGPEAFSIEQIASAIGEADARLMEEALIREHRTLFPNGMNKQCRGWSRLAGGRDWLTPKGKHEWPPRLAAA